MNAAQVVPLPEASSVRWFVPSENPGPLVLSGATKEAFEALERELFYIDRFLAAGVDPPTRVLFSGPSGTGKTLAARVLARALRKPLALIDISGTVKSHVGETTGNLVAAFQAVAGRGILFLDEIDAVCLKRGEASGDAGRELERCTSALFQQLDWLGPSQIVIAATNFPDELDDALRRRITTEIAFEVVDRDARRRMLGEWLAKAPLTEGQLDAIADQTDGMSGAALRARAMASARRAVMALPKEPPKRRDPDHRAVANGAQAVLRALEGGAP